MAVGLKSMICVGRLRSEVAHGCSNSMVSDDVRSSGIQAIFNVVSYLVLGHSK